MNFSTDRDLLVLEPTLFTDVPFLGQQRVRVTDATLAGTLLTSPSADFVAAGVGFGSVALLAGVPHEVASRVSEHQLTISQVRPLGTEPAIAPGVAGAGQPLELIVRTFAPQAAVVHDALLRLIGIDPDARAFGAPTKEAVLSVHLMTRLEALGTLEQIFSAAAALTGDSAALLRKAQGYHDRFASACHTGQVMLDLDGDGRADHRRRLGVTCLVRA